MAILYTDKERELQWKFRWETTTELEYKLMSANWLTEAEQSDIEFELVRRGSTYVRRSYYDRPTKFFGADGSSLSISGGGDKKVYDWDNIIAAEAAYVDEILSKPIPSASSSEMSQFLKGQTAMIRRVVPSLIAADICGVQPMNKHVDVLPWFNMRSETFSKMDVDAIIAADKDLQPMKPHSNWMDTQKIGRSMREPQSAFSGTRVIDYIGLLRGDEAPKSSTAIAQLLESIKRSEVTHASFFDTEASIDTTSWLTDYQASHEKYIEDALAQPNRFIMDDSVKFTYPHTIENPCGEVSSSLIIQGTEMTGFRINNTSAMWDAYLHSMKAATRELYGVRVGTATAKIPRESSGLMIGTTEGIYPERKPFVQDFFVGEMATYKADRHVSIHAEANALTSAKSEMIVTIPKKREGGSEKLEVKFDIDTASLWASWAAEGNVKKSDHVSETLALLGIGEK